MPGGVRAFYDRLAGSYHLTYADWPNEVRRQGALLERRLKALLGDGPFDIVDCACGIGTQAIGLALRGHRVTASDVSEASVERARKEAAGFGVQVSFAVADMVDLPAGEHDAVIACDNVFPHLPDDETLIRALTAARVAMRAGGVFLASLADYDEAQLRRERLGTPQILEDDEGTRIIQTVADWAPDGASYRFTLLILRRQGDGWGLESHETTDRALRREDVTSALQEAGFGQIRWHSTAESGFFQPIVTARPA